MDDSLWEESLARLLDGRPVTENGVVKGWELYSTKVSKPNLEEIKAQQWSPAEVSLDEMKLIVMAMNQGGLGLEDEVLIEASQAYRLDLKAFADKLVGQRLFAWVSPKLLYPIGDDIHQVITPDGKIWASMNGALLNLWVLEQAYKTPVK